MKETAKSLLDLPDAAGKLWGSDLFSIQGQQVTLGHVVVALSLLVGGVFVAGFLRNRVRSALSRWSAKGRAKLNPTDRAIIEKGTFLVVFLIAVDVALNLIGIRPSTLHFMAGGLAVGIGFGGKELFNNLISGVIVLVERPVKIGDIVEVDGEVGNIAEIGIRSIRLETAMGLDVMLPNRVFLEEKLINWTKHNRVILDKVRVGIAYASDIHRAMEVMVGALDVEGVLHEPSPFVEFAEHGESALMFDAYYAVVLDHPIQRARYQSRVNVALNDALRAANIEIAFPQLDVHVRDAGAPSALSTEDTDS
ncbi:MAG: mechanosensitive ion channel domain-containing protein [Polyangiales bacterium]